LAGGKSGEILSGSLRRLLVCSFTPMDATKILTREEVAAVLKDLKRRRRKVNAKQNLIIFRLSCCCGLRVKEICGLDLGDVLTAGARPCIRIRKAITKGREGQRRGRIIPLWWDQGTLDDLTAWKEFRLGQGAGLDEPVICSLYKARLGRRLRTTIVADRWKTAIKALGEERVRMLSIHCGRHSFCSHALFAGRSVVEVRDAVGHKSVNTTSLYSHLLERENVPDVFSFTEPV
jgi:integrase/recombinase XerC